MLRQERKLGHSWFGFGFNKLLFYLVSVTGVLLNSEESLVNDFTPTDTDVCIHSPASSLSLSLRERL